MTWRDEILKAFPPHAHRLTLAADPDGLLTEEVIAAELERRSYETLGYGDDPIAFRYAYERDHRSRWETDQESCLVVAIRGDSRELKTLPYDLIRVGRRLSFGLGDLLPNLDHSTITELEIGYLDKLYAAYRQHTPKRLLGRNETADYVLLHVYGVVPETVSSPEDLIEFLLRRHYSGWKVPEPLDARLLERLGSNGAFGEWSLREILPRREAFLAFLQERWPIFLRRRAESEGLIAREESATYETEYAGPKVLPFDGDRMRVYVDNMFLEGMLRPVPSPIAGSESTRLTSGWLSFGLQTSPEQDRARRLERLLERARQSAPGLEAKHADWLSYARTWAELTALRNASPPAAHGLHLDGEFQRLREGVDGSFQAWVEERYGGLHNLSSTAMVHHVAREMGRQVGQERVALVVVDGLALWQWVPVRDILRQGASAPQLDERTVFAWVPTITPVSRQAIFAASPPSSFPRNLHTTSQEPKLWRRFWTESVGLDPGEVSYANVAGDGDAREIDEYINHRTRVTGVVVQKVDRIIHGMELGERGMHNQLVQWAQEGYLAHLLSRLLEHDFEVYLTSDHGNVEARGIGRPNEGAAADIRGERVRVFNDTETRSRVAGGFPGSVEWAGSGLPKDYLPLLAPGRGAFIASNKRIVGHGGISLEELVVPFVRIQSRTGGGDV